MTGKYTSPTIDHLSFYATDYAKTKMFFRRTARRAGQPVVWIAEVRETDRATARHVAFVAEDHPAVDAFYPDGNAVERSAAARDVLTS